jgi:hypothetical protein
MGVVFLFGQRTGGRNGNDQFFHNHPLYKIGLIELELSVTSANIIILNP